MSNPDQIRVFFSLFLVNLPTVLVCLVAVFIILSRGQSSSGFWALIGFGLALILCIVMPIVHVILQQWVFQNGEQESRMWALTAASIVGSVLHAAVYGLLLAAILAERTKSAPTS